MKVLIIIDRKERERESERERGSVKKEKQGAKEWETERVL